eukprot:204421_1
MIRNASLMGRSCHWINHNVNANIGTCSLYGSLCNTELLLSQKRFKHKFSYEQGNNKKKLKNNQGARDRFIFMHDGTILRGPIAFKTKRIHQSRSKRQKKKNQFFELKGKYRRKARLLVPYFKSQYCRRWEMKSLPVWYREHWQNLEVKTETPDVFKRAVKEPHKLEKIRKI